MCANPASLLESDVHKSGSLGSVRNFDIAEEIQRLDLEIKRKSLQAAKAWLLLGEALRRLNAGELLLRGQMVESEDSKHLNALFLPEDILAAELYEEKSIVTVELSFLEEKRTRLVEAQKDVASRQVSFQKESRNYGGILRQNSPNHQRLHEDQTAPPYGSGNRLNYVTVRQQPAPPDRQATDCARRRKGFTACVAGSTGPTLMNFIDL